MNTIITTIIVMGVLGLLAAVLLVVAAKLMYVKIDPKVEQIRAVLPGANCGVCGFSGCDVYAAALAKGETTPELCRPGGADGYKNLVEILGGTADGDVPARSFAIVCCIAGPDAKSDKISYSGIDTCLASEQLYGGKNACSFGCLGFGDCVPVCPENAICVKDGVARIDTNKCFGCGKCVAACPRGVIVIRQMPVHAEIQRTSTYVEVLCKNTERGAVLKDKCKAGCIACTKCVRECPEKAIEMVDNLAVIDHAKCNGCGHCVEVCMKKCIAPLELMDK